MQFFQGSVKHQGHDGQFILLLPQGLFEGHAFSVYWTLSDTPNFYCATFTDTIKADDINKQTFQSVHRGSNCHFSFHFDLHEEKLENVSIDFSWDGVHGTVTGLDPLDVGGFTTSKDGHESSVYAGLFSSRLLIFSMPWDSADEETAQILLVSPPEEKTPGGPPPIEQEDVVFETWERAELGKGRFTARSARWMLEGESRGEDTTALHVRVRQCHAVDGKDDLATESSPSGPPIVLSLIFGGSFFFIPIALTLINDSGQTFQYWTARGDPHVVEDMFNLGMDVLSFVAPDWKPSKLVGMVKRGADIVEKLKSKIDTYIKPFSGSGAKSAASSAIDFLQRKTGKIGNVELLEHGQRVTFWDFDGTVTGTVDMSITWFDFDRVNNILGFFTAKRSFNKLQSGEVRASTLFDRGTFKPGERLRRRGKIKDVLPSPWERSSTSIKLAQSDYQTNFHGLKLGKLTLSKGAAIAPSVAPTVWPNGMIYDPFTTDSFKMTFDWTSSDVSGDEPVGFLDNKDLLFIRGDDEEYPADDCSAYDTRGTFVKDYFFAPQSDQGSPEKNKALSYSANVVFLEYAYIEEGNKGKYPVEKVVLGNKVYNPKISMGGDKKDKSKYYDPFMKCIQDGLKQGSNWQKNFWAFWWEPGSMHVHGAVYMDRKENENAGVSPWVIKRKYPAKNDYSPDCSQWPVVAFVCTEHLPIEFQKYGKDDDKDI